MSSPENPMVYIKPKLTFHSELKQITFSEAQSTPAPAPARSPAVSSEQRHNTTEAVNMVSMTDQEWGDYVQNGLRPGGSFEPRRYASTPPNRDGTYRMEGGRMVYYDKKNMPRP